MQQRSRRTAPARPATAIYSPPEAAAAAVSALLPPRVPPPIAGSRTPLVLSRHDQTPDLRRTGAEQRRRAGEERAAGGSHVIDQQHRLARNQTRVCADEGAFDVGLPLGAAPAYLLAGLTHASSGVDNRQTQPATKVIRQKASLVVAALPLAFGVQRQRREHSGRRQLPHHRLQKAGQWLGHSAVTVVLQPVDGQANGAVVASRGPNAVDARAIPGAVLAARAVAHFAPTALAQRRRHEVNLSPAFGADPISQPAALHAAPRQEEIEGGAERSVEARQRAAEGTRP